MEEVNAVGCLETVVEEQDGERFKMGLRDGTLILGERYGVVFARREIGSRKDGRHGDGMSKGSEVGAGRTALLLQTSRSYTLLASPFAFLALGCTGKIR